MKGQTGPLRVGVRRGWGFARNSLKKHRVFEAAAKSESGRGERGQEEGAERERKREREKERDREKERSWKVNKFEENSE